MDFLAEARRMAPSLSRGMPFVYILQLRSGLYYIGCTSNFEIRFRDHQNGTACRTTKIDPPASLLWLEIHPDFVSARKREAQIKKWSRAKKNALVIADFSALHDLSRSRELS